MRVAAARAACRARFDVAGSLATCAPDAGSLRAFFKGNGANVVKIAPETAMKLTLNDTIRHAIAADPNHVRVEERVLSGGLAGAIAQVRCGGSGMTERSDGHEACVRTAKWW